MRNSWNYIILLIVLSLASSCAKEVSQEELVAAAVQLKLDQWKIIQLKECSEKAYIKAEDFVDSLLLVTSLENKLDTIPKPEKPLKPEKPAFKIKPDSVIVDPIYKKD